MQRRIDIDQFRLNNAGIQRLQIEAGAGAATGRIPLSLVRLSSALKPLPQISGQTSALRSLSRQTFASAEFDTTRR